MIKTIKKFQIKLTPFNATKEWKMSSTNNQDLLLMDNTSSFSDEPIALEFIDYGELNNPSPMNNFECDIALEQQPDDLINTRIGLNISGLFYPDLDPTNADDTYQRLVFSQVRTMFYNQFHDPTKTWGMNNIDFDLSKTKRKISDQIRLFDTPQFIYGDQLVPNTITVIDDSIDDIFSITDDGDGNLLAGTNLFSKQQELRDFTNQFQIGNDINCNLYFQLIPYSPVLTGSLFNTGSLLTWQINSGGPTILGFGLEKSIDGISFSTFQFLSASVTSSTDPATIYANTSSYYRIYAYNSNGNSPYSNIVSVSITSIHQYQSAELWGDSAKVLPTNISDHASYVVGNTAYIIGGRVTQNGTDLNIIWTSSAGDPSIIGISSATLPAGNSHAVLKQYGNTLYLFGGISSGTGTNTIYTASTSTPTIWGLGGTLPISVYNHYIVTIGDILYLFGGYTGIINSASYTASISNPVVWSSKQTVNWNDALPSYFGQSIIINNTIWLYGGFDGGAGYSGESQTVLSASTSSPFNWGKASSTVIDYLAESNRIIIGNYMYLLCGYHGATGFAGSYKITFDTSSLMNPFVYSGGTVVPGAGRVSISSVVYNGKIYVYGGGLDPFSFYPASSNTIFTCSYTDLGLTSSADKSNIGISDEPWHAALNY